MKQMDVAHVREAVKCNLGRRVKIRSHVGKRKFNVMEGVLSETYPSIFVIKVGEDESDLQTVSYTYTDVITKEVQMMLC
ncbi:Veg family protein [Anaerolentibacter hominis]|uniref:Veg family protein n=1 Tax=Anaerolentibacter hominis TaxID=3079009 RepID=UPI0031B878CB